MRLAWRSKEEHMIPRSQRSCYIRTEENKEKHLTLVLGYLQYVQYFIEQHNMKKSSVLEIKQGKNGEGREVKRENDWINGWEKGGKGQGMQKREKRGTGMEGTSFWNTNKAKKIKNKKKATLIILTCFEIPLVKMVRRQVLIVKGRQPDTVERALNWGKASIYWT